MFYLNDVRAALKLIDDWHFAQRMMNKNMLSGIREGERGHLCSKIRFTISFFIILILIYNVTSMLSRIKRLDTRVRQNGNAVDSAKGRRYRTKGV